LSGTRPMRMAWAGSGSSLADPLGADPLSHQAAQFLGVDRLPAGDLSLGRADLFQRTGSAQQVQRSSSASRSDTARITASGRPLRVITTRSWVSRTSSSTADSRALASASGIVVMT